MFCKPSTKQSIYLKEYQGLVIGNQAANFSVGANIGMIFMMAVEQEYDELTWQSKHFRIQ
jgi:3-hydroxyacyl-CoA dehydrogenase